ncbi:hypothetical protein HDU67_000946, partial [Dinochytrium kinnereticum]
MLIIAFAHCAGRRRRSERRWDTIQESGQGVSEMRAVEAQVREVDVPSITSGGVEPRLGDDRDVEDDSCTPILEDGVGVGLVARENADGVGDEMSENVKIMTEYGVAGDGKWVDLGMEWPETDIVVMNNSPQLYPHSWNVDDVQSWLDSVGFREHICKAFKDHAIDGFALIHLTDHYLQTKLGFTSSHLRSTILRVRDRAFLPGQSSTPTTASTDRPLTVSPLTLSAPATASEESPASRSEGDSGVGRSGGDWGRAHRNGRGRRQHLDAFDEPPPYL